MAAFNFPNSPNTNDTHTENSVVWKWDGEKWIRVEGVGAQGATGAQGVQGAQGRQGAQGNTGGGGAGGAQGHQGHQGATGSGGGVGAQGAQGHQGHQGVQGAQGHQGHQGRQGTAGGTGAQGHQGVQGAPAAGANGIVKQVVNGVRQGSWSQSVGAGNIQIIPSFQITITPSSTSSKVLVSLQACIGLSSDNRVSLILYRNGSALSGARSNSASGNNNVTTTVRVWQSWDVYSVSFEYLDSPSTTSACTYTVGILHDSSSTKTVQLGRSSSSNYHHAASFWTAKEIG